MADLLAKQEPKLVRLSRGQEVEGGIIAITRYEIVLDLGTKSEGVLQKRDLSPEQAANLKVGDKLLTYVVHPESDSGQVVLGLQKTISRSLSVSSRWSRFEQALGRNQSLKGRGIEVNKGGLIVEVDGVRGFLPSSQVALSDASNIEGLIGKDIDVTVIEVDPSQNRLIFSQKTKVSEDTKDKLSKLSVGDKAEGKVAAVLPFGVFVSLNDGVEGLVHISEVSWDKVEDTNNIFNVGDEVEAKVISIDANTGRVNLSIKQLSQDPFVGKVKDIRPDDVVKAEVTKITSQGIFLMLANDTEGFMHVTKMEPEKEYEVGEKLSCLVDSVDNQKRRVNLVPFVTSTAGLIYK